MNKAKSSNNVSDLLAAIQRVPTIESAPEQQTIGESKTPTRKLKAPITSKKPGIASEPSKVGKPVQFWLHDEDRKIIRELSAWLAGQGIRPSDSMVIRAALRVSRTGSELIEAYKRAAELDGRYKRKTL